MASKADVEAGRAFVLLHLKNDMSHQLVRALRKAQGQLRNFGRNAMSAGLKTAATGAAMVAPFILGMREFANFDAAMGNVATMLDNPDEFMPGFRQGIKDMSVEFGKSKEDLATGLYDILSATVPPEQALERLAAAAKLATAGNAEVGSSVSVLNTLMDTYGDSFRDAADASDFLFAIVKRGRTNLTELSGSLGNIIATAKAAGMTVEDMGAAVALLTRATGGTDTALTALNAISATFLKPGTEGAALWKQKFGEAMDANTLKAIGMTGVLERMSTLDAGDVANIFPNLRALRGIFPAISKMGGFSDDLAEMANRAGNVGEAFEKVKGPLFYWKQGLEQGKNVLLEIGDAVAAVLVPYKDMVIAIGKSVEVWVKNNKGLVVGLAATAVGVGTLGFALMSLAITSTVLSVVFGTLAAVIAAVTSPVGFLVAALVGGAAAWMKFTENGKRALASLGSLVETLKTAFGGITDALMGGSWELAGQIAMTGLKLAVLQGLSAIQQAFPKTFETILRVIGRIGDGIVFVWNKVTGFMIGIWNSWGKHIVLGAMGAASKFAEIWQGTVEGLANWMLKTSAQGGAMGKLMSKILGVDMAEVQAERDRLNKSLGLGPENVLGETRQAVKDYVDSLKLPELQAGTGTVSGGLEDFLSKLESGSSLDDIAKELAALRGQAAGFAKLAAPGGPPPGGGRGGGGGGAGGGGPLATIAPRGVALTATYSAAAARISGYQPGGGGVEEKMAVGIGGINENTKQMVTKFGVLLGQGSNQLALFQQFLAGWQVN